MNKSLTNADEYRGYFISEFAKLERTIDVYLATFFVPNNPNLSNDLISILIDRITFENKRGALKALFDLRNDLDYSNHKKTSTFKKIIDATGELARIRNCFAHYHSVMVTDKMRDENDVALGLIQFRDSLTIIWYDKDKFYKLIEKITLTRNAIELLRKSD